MTNPFTACINNKGIFLYRRDYRAATADDGRRPFELIFGRFVAVSLYTAIYIYISFDKILFNLNNEYSGKMHNKTDTAAA